MALKDNGWLGKERVVTITVKHVLLAYRLRFVRLVIKVTTTVAQDGTGKAQFRLTKQQMMLRKLIEVLMVEYHPHGVLSRIWWSQLLKPTEGSELPVAVQSRCELAGDITSKSVSTLQSTLFNCRIETLKKLVASWYFSFDRYKKGINNSN